MGTRRFWVAALVVGGIIAFLWPYVVPGSDDPFAAGLFRATAWVLGAGAAYLVLNWISSTSRLK